MTDHTPEPYGPYVHGETRHARIRACVNACAGIPTEQLGSVKAVVEALEAVIDMGYEDRSEVWAQANAALAAFRKD